MPTQQRIRLPISLLILDVIGPILIAIGLGEKFGAFMLVPDILKFNNYQIIMIIIGVALTIPPLIYIIKRVKGDMPREI